MKIARAIYLGTLAASIARYPAAAADGAVPLSDVSRPSSAHESAAATPPIETYLAVAQRPQRANFERERASGNARYIADWVVDSGDNHRMPFVIVDKPEARVFVFDADGRLRGAAAALLGLARGDHTVPGIGDRELSNIRPEERTTPAGRFVAALDRNLRGQEILWVDYDSAVSLHRVPMTKNKDRRQERLATPTPLDNRISYGCINVPAKFYDDVVRPAFSGTNGIVYVLPEIRSIREVFASYDVEEHARPQTVSQPLPAPIVSGAAGDSIARRLIKAD